MRVSSFRGMIKRCSEAALNAKRSVFGEICRIEGIEESRLNNENNERDVIIERLDLDGNSVYIFF